MEKGSNNSKIIICPECKELLRIFETTPADERDKVVVRICMQGHGIFKLNGGERIG